jgi:hypothetical protein
MELYGSGEVAKQVDQPRWRLLYLIDRGVLPGPSHEVPGRRLFTPEDVKHIKDSLNSRPELHRSANE